MEKVWLATKYYLDDKLVGCTATTERLFTRLVAWCGDNETGGHLPENPHKFVALPSGKSNTSDLVSRQVLIKKPEGGYRFNGWGNWNSQMDDLQKRKKADRERKRKQREASDECHVTGHVTSHAQSKSKRKKEITTTEVVDTPHVSNAPDDERRGPAVPIDAWTIIRSVVPREHSQATKTALALEASSMLVAGTPEDDVRATLELWLSKPNLGPRVLPHLLSDVIRSRAPTPGVGAATTKAQGWLNIANQANQLMNEQRAIE